MAVAALDRRVPGVGKVRGGMPVGGPADRLDLPWGFAMAGFRQFMAERAAKLVAGLPEQCSRCGIPGNVVGAVEQAAACASSLVRASTPLPKFNEVVRQSRGEECPHAVHEFAHVCMRHDPSHRFRETCPVAARLLAPRFHLRRFEALAGFIRPVAAGAAKNRLTLRTGNAFRLEMGCMGKFNSGLLGRRDWSILPQRRLLLAIENRKAERCMRLAEIAIRCQPRFLASVAIHAGHTAGVDDGGLVAVGAMACDAARRGWSGSGRLGRVPVLTDGLVALHARGIGDGAERGLVADGALRPEALVRLRKRTWRQKSGQFDWKFRLPGFE